MLKADSPLAFIIIRCKKNNFYKTHDWVLISHVPKIIIHCLIYSGLTPNFLMFRTNEN